MSLTLTDSVQFALTMGQAGVKKMIDTLYYELHQQLQLVGGNSLDELDASYVSLIYAREARRTLTSSGEHTAVGCFHTHVLFLRTYNTATLLCNSLVTVYNATHSYSPTCVYKRPSFFVTVKTIQ